MVNDQEVSPESVRAPSIDIFDTLNLHNHGKACCEIAMDPQMVQSRSGQGSRRASCVSVEPARRPQPSERLARVYRDKP